ncbi:MAG TPA: stage II sporulation protein M [Candidatus Deferrimicrobium sp.]|nr:stage II sporulation protein M [Candidatus Deferrimicrobium sp.]
MAKSKAISEKDTSDEEFIKSVLSKHWKMALIAVIGGIVVLICSIFVVLWFINNFGYGAQPLGTWTMGELLEFILRLILWEFLLIGIAAIAVTVVVGLHWWKRLPDEEQEEIWSRWKRRETQKNIVYASSGSILSLLVSIAFLIIIYLDGNWDTALGNLPLTYFVYTALWALMWVLVIFGIPIGITILLWLRRIMKKET